MIKPADVYKYFKVRHIPTGRTLWILGGDTRYAITGPSVGQYRMAADGDCILLRSAVETHPWGWCVRPDEVEPLPDDAGTYHPDYLATKELQLSMTYAGSWRQAAIDLNDTDRIAA